jgi:hypothetical protein
MSFMDKAGEVSGCTGEAEKVDEAIRDFRLSVHAWSEAAYSRPRTVVAPAPRQIWRLAAGWALACVLVAGGASAGVWEHHQHVMKVNAARIVEQQRLVALERARLARMDEENLLARVDSDVSREVPSAMEPLAQLMAEDETK